MLNSLLSLRYPKFKLALVLLLTINAFIYAIFDTLTSAADALIWLVLLVLYELEANGVKPFAEDILEKLRNLFIVLITLVFIAYVRDQQWLDVTNNALWFGLIALFELEVRWPDTVLEYRQTYWLATVAVFGGLIAMVLVWAWQSAWLDVYDATLWILAFASIEVDIFQVLQVKSR